MRWGFACLLSVTSRKTLPAALEKSIGISPEDRYIPMQPKEQDETMKTIARQLLLTTAILVVVAVIGCNLLVKQFRNLENGVLVTAKHKPTASFKTESIFVMTWNVRFGAGREPWFGDGCGTRAIFSEAEIRGNLNRLAAKINELKPDILLLQEVDVRSKRSGDIDEVQWLLDNTYFNYGAYASMWQAKYIPSHGLGRINTGQAVLSRWKITKGRRLQLPLRGDQNALVRYFYLRRCMLVADIALPGADRFCVVNTHLDAFSTDGTKKKQIDRVKEELDLLTKSGVRFVAGGDFNLMPPGSDSTDFCLKDKCPGQSFHGPNDNPRHKEGSCFTPEITWLQPLIDAYSPSVPLDRYAMNQKRYFTSSPDPVGLWDRKIDHLFTNTGWVPGSDTTYQHIIDLSDHVPVAARWELPRQVKTF